MKFVVSVAAFCWKTNHRSDNAIMSISFAAAGRHKHKGVRKDDQPKVPPSLFDRGSFAALRRDNNKARLKQAYARPFNKVRVRAVLYLKQFFFHQRFSATSQPSSVTRHSIVTSLQKKVRW